ncbi:MAG: hypothetical protein PHR35_07960 [Kiritimatiellae bacterium]|nr:hypothetical protein [Kiritimatiellia bacterium]
MLPTTVEAVKALLKADPVLTPLDRQRIVTAIRNHGKDAAPPQRACVVEKRILSRRDVARRFSRSVRFVDDLGKAGILRRVKLPGRRRACGFLAEEVERVMGGEEVTK